MSDQRLADALGFAAVTNFQEWLHSRLVRPYFEFFEKSTEHLKADTEGKKGSELKSIERLIASGESGGKQRYSRDIIEDADMAEWSQADHQARLIYKLTVVNTENFRGPFFGKNLPQSHKISLMWDIYLRHNWRNAPSKKRKAKSSLGRSLRKTTLSTSLQEASSSPLVSSATPNSSSSAEMSKAATFRVMWENVPDELISTATVLTLVTNVQDLTEAQFRTEVAKKLGLEAHNAIITEIDYQDEDSFGDAVESALLGQGRKNAFVYTGDSTDTTLPHLFEDNLVRQTDPKAEMDIMIEEFKEMKPSETRLYRWRICQAVGLSSNISPEVIAERAAEEELELDPSEENLQVRLVFNFSSPSSLCPHLPHSPLSFSF